MVLTAGDAVLGFAAVLVAITAVVCDSDANAPTPAASTTPSLADATPAAPDAAACAPTRPLAAGSTNQSFGHGGLTRTYILHIPPQYDGARPLPLVLNLHGFGSNARQQAMYSQLPPKADSAAFVVVTPDGTGNPPHWNILALPNEPDDIAFVGALLDDLETRLCVDASSIFAAGMSNGAAFSARLACAMPERLAAIAVVGAFIYPRACSATGAVAPTNAVAPTDAVAVVGFHGTADPCVPYEGGQSKCGALLPVPVVEDAAKSWARHNGCNTEPARTTITEHVRATTYSECDAESAVVLYTIDGGGHTWPGSVDVARLGPTTQEIDATDLIWAFFVTRHYRY